MIYGFDLGVRVKKLRYGWVLGKNRVYESVNVLGVAIRADSVPQCIMKACRVGRFNFSLTLLHILWHYLPFKLREFVRHMSVKFSFKHIAIKVKNIVWYGFTFFDFWNWTPVLIILYACLYSNSMIYVDKPKQSLKTQFISQLSQICCVILQSCRLCCCSFKPFFVSWVTPRRKSTA